MSDGPGGERDQAALIRAFLAARFSAADGRARVAVCKAISAAPVTWVLESAGSPRASA